MKSSLHLREAVNPILGGILSIMTPLRDIIEGRFDIPGVPGFIEDLLEDVLRRLIDAYVPAWATELISALGNLNELLDDIRIQSTVELRATAPDLYRADETWDLLEFRFRGEDFSGRPADILAEVMPGSSAGDEVRLDPWTAREDCGRFLANRHSVRGVIGGLIRWAIEVAITAVSCAAGTCFTSIDDLFGGLIDCDALGGAVADALRDMTGGLIDLTGPITDACRRLAGGILGTLIRELDGITVRMELLELQGNATIRLEPDWDNDGRHLDSGRWDGRLAGGNFPGEFEATKW
jgi:hypothetical protein